MPAFTFLIPVISGFGSICSDAVKWSQIAVIDRSRRSGKSPLGPIFKTDATLQRESIRFGKNVVGGGIPSGVSPEFEGVWE
ncbi:MAG: hypothetical protein CBC13_07410 [Planctomycetia bacterium TMED53]|nr:MAG: hypothetical protein CBC13_07410 [Planctomycetia bacterium TMED53]